MSDDVLTTGKVARICRVSCRTAAKWIDSGLLAGWRLPGSRDRRVARSELLKFMAAHDMPTDYFSLTKAETPQAAAA